MGLPHFFIERPIFAAVVAILIVLFGAVSYPTLPVAQYPEIAPPTVTVTANYPGATAETMAETVAPVILTSPTGTQRSLTLDQVEPGVWRKAARSKPSPVTRATSAACPGG